jgi:hypothetical protein
MPVCTLIESTCLFFSENLYMSLARAEKRVHDEEVVRDINRAANEEQVVQPLCAPWAINGSK